MQLNKVTVLIILAVAGCSPNNKLVEQAWDDSVITPGVGLDGRIELGMSLKQIRGTEITYVSKDDSRFSVFYTLRKKGIKFRTDYSGIVNAITFFSRPERESARVIYTDKDSENRFMENVFQGGLSGVTGNITKLKLSDVTAQLGRVPLTEDFLFFDDYLRFNMPVGEVFWDKKFGQRICLYLLYPDIGLKFYVDGNNQTEISSITVLPPSQTGGAVTWCREIPLSVLNNPNPTVDCGQIRAGNGKLHLFTIDNDTKYKILLNECVDDFSKVVCHKYGVTLLNPGEQTYMALTIDTNAIGTITFPVLCSINGQEERTITLKMRKVECGWDAATIGKETVRGH